MRTVRAPVKQLLILSAALALGILVEFAISIPIRAHEPITTKIMFNKEVVRIFQRNCLGCHRPGGIAPMSLATYEEARPWAKAIKEELLEKRMPPWQAVKGYGEFRNVPPLTQREVDLIVNWVEGGAPRGDPKDVPKDLLSSAEWPLGKPDLILRPESSHPVSSDSDEHKTLILPTKLKSDRFLRAIELRPDKSEAVHCATFYLQSTMNGGAGKQELLGTWVPGMKNAGLPADTARLVPAGSKILARIHYRGCGEDTKDRSEIGLYFASKAMPKSIRQIEIDDSSLVIPGGAEAYRFTKSLTIEEDVEAVAVIPRMYPLVTSLEATAYRPDGTTEVLLWARAHRFDWQPTYVLERPVMLPKGTRVEVVGYFDNSEGNRSNPNSPPRQLRRSEVSQDPLVTLLLAIPLGGN